MTTSVGSDPVAERPAAHGSTRSKARKRAVDILFESELRESDPLATLAERTADAAPPVRDYTAPPPGWTLARLPRVDRTVLRIAVYEIDHTEVPDGVAVSEAVALVGDLSTDNSPGFVNGVLGTVLTDRGAGRPHVVNG